MTDPLFVLDTIRENTPLTSDELHAGWNLTLPDTVRRHAVQVMRLRGGDALQLSDGSGLRVRATLVDPAQGIARVNEVGREPRPTTRLALIQALAKTGRDEQAIDMATQIGVDGVIPWQAERSIAKWKEGRSDRKWRQTLGAATEQSRRAWVPELGPCSSSKQVLAMCRRASVHGDLVIVLHQDATTTWGDIEERVSALAQRCLADGRERTISVVVGPEGGISEREITQFAGAGAQVCVLGSTIMRASSAGPVALALLSRALGRFA
ncbi:16S rRNA (uracil(1498)-N(3))-methyltransferase [Bifidobacterium sp.]|jgi:16S rRNA (uracil1498-N3)-methyltransferase|uniref:16S rRNA (uracil(1498)-N(3))-methyltransferase n=1 Tax=Bifidobacterium sp. TaxID=41200 RepID=UPI0025BF1DA7|nr:16S rRNA (uracil(1498)-N(3))-methyltransferase [Bifidobacterium sp.]MCH4209851.1 16S rRNA (uracil(1498)-N(3))-methyltransferase [Bifidobacterium sp.]MCI1224172.1 16S rRNA (uracil(1498)-N(3))-methyltransferase [Bifidobacterium sp.]